MILIFRMILILILRGENDIVGSSPPENVHVEERRALELEHQEQRVENDQEQDEVLKRRRSNQPPDVIPTHQGQSKLRYLCLCCSRCQVYSTEE